MEIVDTLFRSVFIAFIVWTIFWALTAREEVIGRKTEAIDKFITRTTIVFGVIHIGFLITSFIDWQDGITISESVQKRAFGGYWFGFWVYPLTYFGLTQLLWIREIRVNKTIRVIMALWIFVVMHIEKFVIFMASLHRDYSPH